MEQKQKRVKFNCDWVGPQPRARQRPKRDTDPSTGHTLLFLTHKFLLSKCGLCGPETGNIVRFEVTFGSEDDLILHVCRWCLQDLKMLGFTLNQILPFRNQRANIVARQPAVLGVCFEAPMEAICHGK